MLISVVPGTAAPILLDLAAGAAARALLATDSDAAGLAGAAAATVDSDSSAAAATAPVNLVKPIIELLPDAPGPA